MESSIVSQLRPLLNHQSVPTLQLDGEAAQKIVFDFEGSIKFVGQIDE